MYDLPPSAFVRSAPCDPRRGRVPTYVTFGLAMAVGASGIIGYSAGYASDTGRASGPPSAVAPVVACRAASPGPTTFETFLHVVYAQAFGRLMG
ncbi:MAG: hypothetical protein HOW71_01190 [Nonomuraea sp.]|nr:hypothetical protein [Nonomuraea sp.]NUP60772.1 hypothetical protein [Nonomuraea sp.]NUS05660.1 hypothetical protein [Nonomuraea sp.]NUT11855.1 hypothetical protein [Nonomuraea sp.]